MNTPAEHDEIAPDTRVRLLSESLKGIEGTVISRRANDRLLVRLETSLRGVCVEIDASAVKWLESPKGT